MATVGATKDMVVANSVDFWKGDSNSTLVFDLFESVTEAAEMGRLSSKDRVHLVRSKLKLRGIAKVFLVT
jgi:hypothetical protein